MKISYKDFGIDEEILRFAYEIEEGLSDRFHAFDATAENNSLKVIAAMQKARITQESFMGTTGYGYHDIGRESLEKTYAGAFGTEAALVRPHIASGTHALTVALSGLLRPGDELLSVSGRPYDTLEEVIGIRPSTGSLAEYGVSYREVSLKDEGFFDHEAIREAIREKTRVVAIQRSRGYASRRSLTVKEIKEAIETVKTVRPDLICLIDNCYGEFVEELEPGDVGGDVIVGSLIKNPGGGIARCGGYIAGRADLIERISYRLTSPGLGSEVGSSGDFYLPAFQGFLLSPSVVASAKKAAVFAASVYEHLGFCVRPLPDEVRTDIIEEVELGAPELLIAFCEGIQKGSYVDSHVRPEPSDMPGYDHDVIMAGGTFISGSSIELSADGPLRPPYSVFFQGGLNWPSAKLGILCSVQSLKDKGGISIPR